MPCRFQNGLQAFDITNAVFIGKDVKQSGIEDVVEALTPVAELQSVLQDESGRNSALCRLALRPCDWTFQKIRSGNGVTSAGKEQRIVSRTATNIQNRPRDPVRSFDECLLRPARFPRGLTGVHLFESLSLHAK